MVNQDKRQTSHTGATIFIAVVVFTFCAFASAFLVAYHRNTIDMLLARWRAAYEKAPAAKPAMVPLQATKGSAIAVWSMRRLLAPPLTDIPRPEFSLADRFATTDFCALLQNLAPREQLKWDKNTFAPASSDCSGQIDVPSPQNDSLHNSLFIQVRRNAAGASTMVRLKLVYLPDRAEPTFKTEFVDGAGVALKAVFSEEPTELMRQIEALSAFNAPLSGINVKLFEEQLVPGAYNLMIEARCGKYGCAATNPYYSLNMPRATTAQEAPATGENTLQ